MPEGAALPTTHDRKSDRVMTHCLYRIATGKWEPGHKLPSVRTAEREWRVDRRTVLEAYKQLADRGLVTCADRSGYFVAQGPELGRLSRHRKELERLFERWQHEIIERTGLSPLGTFRYFAQLATIRATENPSCAFVECTANQAEGHAKEIAARLGVPCLPLSLDEISNQCSKIPSTVRCLLISRFHQGELNDLQSHKKLHVMPVPIEVAPTCIHGLSKKSGVVILFEDDDEQAHDIADDLRTLKPGLKLRTKAIANHDHEIRRWIGSSKASQIALLSPRVWGRLSDTLKKSPRIREIRFQIREDAWPSIADSIGLPLGVLR